MDDSFFKLIKVMVCEEAVEKLQKVGKIPKLNHQNISLFHEKSNVGHSVRSKFLSLFAPEFFNSLERYLLKIPSSSWDEDPHEMWTFSDAILVERSFLHTTVLLKFI